MDLWLAIIPVSITIAILYFSLFRFLRFLYKKHFAWFVAFVTFLSPFIIVLFQAHDLFQLAWILLLTPFYGIFALILISTWVVRFYCLSFAVLLIVWFLFQRRKPEDTLRTKFGVGGFLRAQEKAYNVKRVEKTISEPTKKLIIKSLCKCWSLWLSIFLLIILTSTLVSTASPVNPSYTEAQQFVASTNTEIHTYTAGSYTCVNFATDFRNSALRAGYLCGYTFVYFHDAQSHVLNCFNTTDKGLVFVEPQWGKFVNITIGKPYQYENLTLSLDNNTVLWYYSDFETSCAVP